MKTKKTTTQLEGEKKKPKNIDVIFVNNELKIVNNAGIATGMNPPLTVATQVAAGVRLAARLVDAHPEFMTTTRFAHEVQSLVYQHNKNAVYTTDTPAVTMKQIVGEELDAQHYGGLYGVGT